MLECCVNIVAGVSQCLCSNISSCSADCCRWVLPHPV